MSEVDDLLESLADHPDVTVVIGAGIEHSGSGRTTLFARGDGHVEIVNRAHGSERTFEASIVPDRIALLGRELADLGLTSLAPRQGNRLPGDVPVRVEVRRDGRTLHEADLWHGDRYEDPALDGVLKCYEPLVSEITGGELPWGRG